MDQEAAAATITAKVASQGISTRDVLFGILMAIAIPLAASGLVVGFTPALRFMVTHAGWVFSFLAFPPLALACVSVRRQSTPCGLAAMWFGLLFMFAGVLWLFTLMSRVPAGTPIHLAAAMESISSGHAIAACTSNTPRLENNTGTLGTAARYDYAAGICALPDHGGYYARYVGADGAWAFFLLPNALHTGWLFNAGPPTPVDVFTCHQMAALRVPGWRIEINGQPASPAACRYPTDNTVIVYRQPPAATGKA